MEMKMTTEMTASDFIRKHPKKTPKAILALAEEKGVKFSANLVYAVRSTDKRKKAKKAPPKKRRAKTTALAKGSAKKVLRRVRRAKKAPIGSPSEVQFLKQACLLGLNRSRELLEEVETRLLATLQ